MYTAPTSDEMIQLYLYSACTTQACSAILGELICNGNYLQQRNRGTQKRGGAGAAHQDLWDLYISE